MVIVEQINVWVETLHYVSCNTVRQEMVTKYFLSHGTSTWRCIPR